MRFPIVTRIVGIFLLLFSLTLIPTLLVALYTRDGEAMHFLQSILLLAIPGLLLWYPNRRQKAELHNKEAFLVVALFWVLLGMLGSLPLLLGAHLSLTDAVFEAVSGFTTTGATVIVGIDNLPASILIYRQQLMWMGGIGVVVLAVAILPMLGVGGMQLYRLETAGPMKDEKLTPRITHTARAVWVIYLSLTVICAAAYWLTGMSAFDAIAHSFSTVSTGGFSTHDASLGFFNNPAVETVAIIFMILGGISFNVHFLFFHGRGVTSYWNDPQTRTFLIIIVALITANTLLLYLGGTYGSLTESLRYGAFQVTSIITTTGFTTTDFSLWPVALPLLLMFAGHLGGCAGSTSGGIKVVRVMVLGKVGIREMMRLIHPNMVRPIKISGRALPKSVLDAVWSFFSIYVAVFIGLMILVMATGVDQVTAFGAVTACLTNIGPGLGDVSSNFHDVNPVAKWLCTFAMLLGRLEIFTLLVLFSPVYWRK
ncbi:MAG: potassium transporter [Gammaproteobacteria bacterium]|nr:potassium transporter [Gammaproteobacteria bacterium]